MTQNILIAYYSWAGNTKKIAGQIQNETNGTLFEIIPETPYPQDYNETVQQAKKEIADGFKPALKTKINDIDSYDLVFIGSPNWWSTNAPPVDTFCRKMICRAKPLCRFVHTAAAVRQELRRISPNSVRIQQFWKVFVFHKTVSKKRRRMFPNG